VTAAASAAFSSGASTSPRYWARARRIETRHDRSFSAFRFDDARVRMLQKIRQPARESESLPRQASRPPAKLEALANPAGAGVRPTGLDRSTARLRGGTAEQPSTCTRGSSFRGRKSPTRGGVEDDTGVAADTFTLVHEDNVPGWYNQGSDLIEIWDTPFLGTTASEGDNLIEVDVDLAPALLPELEACIGAAAASPGRRPNVRNPSKSAHGGS
jgi:hypothetical protein